MKPSIIYNTQVNSIVSILRKTDQICPRVNFIGSEMKSEWQPGGSATDLSRIYRYDLADSL